MTSQEFSISINCKHLYSFLPSRRLYQQLVHYPQVIFLVAAALKHTLTSCVKCSNNTIWLQSLHVIRELRDPQLLLPLSRCNVVSVVLKRLTHCCGMHGPSSLQLDT